MNKKNFFVFLLVALLALPLFANAQPINIGAILGRVKTILFVIFDAIAVIIVVYAGIKYLTARGDPTKVNEANKALIWGAVGVAVGLLAPFISGIVNWLLVG